MHAIRADFAFDGVRFVDGGATVLVDGTTIVGVESVSYDVPQDCPLLDHGRATVLPGLVDSHVHLVGDSSPLALERVADCSDDDLDTVVAAALRAHLAAGVTTVRDLGDCRFNVVARRDRQRAHDDGLPRIVAAGPPITSPGGHCHFLGGEAASREEIVAAVRERSERGVDVVKVMASGGMITPGTDVSAPQFSLDDLRVLVDEAHRAGLPVAVHSHAAEGVDQAIAVGADGIEHGSYLVGGAPAGLAGLISVHATDAQLDALAASGIPVCPTLGGFTPDVLRNAPPHVQRSLADSGITPEQVVAIRLDLLGRMHRAGVRFVSGTDAGVAPPKPHGVLPRAVAELAAVVGTPEALVGATSRAAHCCGVGGTTGRLAAGFDADLLVVEGDLAADVTALGRVRQVVLRGGVVTST